ncbi:NAD-binding protein [Lactiplantibacillus argentoratensis]|nr:NAD-binding protein [Lactiplantibacillus argentoratensis]
MYTHFGSEVTVIEAGQKLLPRFEPECGQYLCTR